MTGAYTLMLVSLNPDYTDCSGNVYPESGYVEANNYEYDTNILHGLYGTKWGLYKNNRWLNMNEKAKWLVVRVEKNNDLIPLDKNNAFYKFRTGFIVLADEKEKCEQYIEKYRLGNDANFQHAIQPQGCV